MTRALSRADEVDPAPPKPHWSRAPERSSLWAVRLMSAIAIFGGRPLARLLLHPITVYFMLLSPDARRQSKRYLARALGRPPTWRDGYAQVHAFAATVLDRVYLMRGRTRGFEVRASGTHLLDAVLAEGRGAFLVGAHFGSFEALRAVGRKRPEVRVAMVMYEDNARLINETLAAIAPQARATVLPLGRVESMLAIRDWLDGGGLAGMLADRSLPAPADAGTAASGAGSSGAAAAVAGRRSSAATRPGTEPADSATHGTGRAPKTGQVVAAFLGKNAVFGDGPFRLAALLRRRVVFMAGVYEGGGRYEVRFEPLADFSARIGDPAERERRIAEAVRAYAARLEALCRSHPYNWFNFHDFWNEDGH